MLKSNLTAALRAALVLLCLVALGGCGGTAAPQPHDGDDLSITSSWAAAIDLSTAVDPGAAMSVAYADIKNSSDEDDALIRVSSDAVRAIEIHETVTSGNSGSMVEVERVDLPAGSSVSLKPGGLHLMLIGPRDDLVAGTSIDVRFVFESGSEMDMRVPVIDRADRP